MLDEFFHAYEESLKEFLIEEKDDHKTSRNAIAYRYNNLKIFADSKRYPEPHIIIRIGISEAIYKLEDGEKLSGGIGSDERIIRKWLLRNLSKIHTNSAADPTKKKKTVKMSMSDYETEENQNE